MKKTLRLLLFEDCNRNCKKCCNKQWDLKLLPEVGSFKDWDEIILTGGEPAAAVMVDAITRLIPKVLGNFESALSDSHMYDITGAPCYTRPEEYQRIKVLRISLR